MKYFYIVVTVYENEKYYSYAIKVSENDNLLAKLKIKGIINANICHTKKEAYNLVERWRDIYKKAGTYMFDSPQF